MDAIYGNRTVHKTYISNKNNADNNAALRAAFNSELMNVHNCRQKQVVDRRDRCGGGITSQTLSIVTQAWQFQLSGDVRAD